MSDPVFMQITPDLHGAIVAGPNNGFACSVYHEPTGKALYGFEPTFERALGWLDSARLIFTETGGSA